MYDYRCDEKHSSAKPLAWSSVFYIKYYLWNVETIRLCMKIMCMTCSNVSYSIQRNAHKDILIF